MPFPDTQNQRNGFCQGLVHTFPKDSCPSGTRPMEMYKLVLGKTHFSDFGCQEKIQSNKQYIFEDYA